MLDSEQTTTLKATLEELMARCDASERRAHDPVDLVWDYTDVADQEVVALITSCLAYGRVALLKRAVRQVLAALGPTPAATLRASSAQELAALLPGFVYRMTRREDIVDLLAGIAEVLREEAGLESAYMSVDAPGHLEAASGFVQKIRDGRLRSEVSRGFSYLLPDPAQGSASKRLHLFFRWVGRGPDDIDLGIWPSLNPADLIMPLDTHTGRLCRYIGLSERKTVDGKMAMEVTQSLRLLDPDDPLRFDFALCHLGISGQCIHKRSPDHCPGCPIESVCRL